VVRAVVLVLDFNPERLSGGVDAGGADVEPDVVD
jgi:hypothetical protein